MNAITKVESAALSTMSEGELMDVLQSSLYPGANPNSIRMVLGYCKASNLDPMQKPVHIVPVWDGKAKQMRDVTMPGIGLYRIQAARTGQLAGISEAEFGPMVTENMSGAQITYPEWARVVVKRLLPSGHVAEFEAREFWIENYATAGRDTQAPNAMWKKRTRGQIAKCAEAQALRKGFPEVGNQPTAEEMEGKVMDMGHAEVAQPAGAPAPAPATPTLAPWPDDKLQQRFPKYREWLAAGKTHDEIIDFAETKGTLSHAQIAQIHALTPLAPADANGVTDAVPKSTTTTQEA